MDTPMIKTDPSAQTEGLESSFRILVDSVPDACIILDKDLNYVYFNPAAEKSSGLSLESARGKALAMPEGDGAVEWRRAYREVLRTGVPLILEDVVLGGCFGGRRFSMRAIKIGGKLGVIWTDISAEREVEEKLMATQAELRSLASHLLQVREDERRQVSREIHDELGQALTAIDMELRFMARKHDSSPSETRSRIDAILGQSAETLKVVQRIASELRPGVLDHLGLGAAIEWLARDFSQRSGIEAAAEIGIDESLIGEKTATALFRITQEAMTNAARHAHASKVGISLRQRAKRIELEVSDDGIGITDAQASGPRAFGLLGIRERARELGGESAIRGEPGAGTRLSVAIPIPAEGKLP